MTTLTYTYKGGVMEITAPNEIIANEFRRQYTENPEQIIINGIAADRNDKQGWVGGTALVEIEGEFVEVFYVYIFTWGRIDQ